MNPGISGDVSRDPFFGHLQLYSVQSSFRSNWLVVTLVPVILIFQLPAASLNDVGFAVMFWLLVSSVLAVELA